MIDRDYKRWMKLSLVVSKGNVYVAEEVLHIVLEQILTKFNIDEVSDNYMFIALRNRFNSHIKVDSKHVEYDMSLDKEDITTYVEGDEDIKIDIIKRILHTLTDDDKHIFTLHFTRGFSQRKISRELNLKLYAVIQRVKHIKQLINDEYEKYKESNPSTKD